MASVTVYTRDMTQEILKEYFEYDPSGTLIRIKHSLGRGRLDVIPTRVSNGGYLSYRFLNANHYVHRLIFLFHHGYLPKYLDHINRNKLDNRIENLREATNSQNCVNIKLLSNNTSGHVGVRYRKNARKWEVAVAGKYYGLFPTEGEAIAQRIKIAKELYGEFVPPDTHLEL
jgi:hypothetical protein